MQLAAGAGVRARPRAQAGRRDRGGHRRRRSADGDRPQLGAHRRQRQRARSAEPAGQRPPDVAADAAGAGLAERRHRHLERRPLQRPRQPAERHQVRRRRRLRHHRRRRPATSNGQIASPFKLQASLENVQEFRVESNNYPAEFGTGTGGQVSVVTKSGANQFRGSLFEYYRNDKLDAPNYFDSTRNTDGSVIQELPKSALNQNQFGGSLGGPLAQGPGLLLRQLRGLSARRRRELRRSGAERGGLGAGGAGDRRRCARASPRRARCSCRARRPTPTSTSTSCRALEKVEENSVSARLDYRLNDQWSSYVRVFHDRGTQPRPEGVSGRIVKVDEQPDQRHLQPAGLAGGGTAERVQGRLQRAARPTSRGVAPVGRRRRLQQPWRST